MHLAPRFLLCGLLLIPAQAAVAAEPWQPIQRRIPPPGIPLPPAAGERLQRQMAVARERLAGLSKHPLSADAEVFLKAVEYALEHGEFYSEKEIPRAEAALREADRRLELLAAGKAPWTRQHGRVVRAFRSPLDGSVQPYGLEIPEQLQWDKPVPLYVWLHGRGDRTTDLHFIDQRQTRAGRIAPPGAIVLHPFGRHCVGFKSAGEVDVLEAVRHVQQHYSIDADRIALMGFSMGGAGVWHLAAHYPDHWVAASPGAGFAETARYNRLTPDTFPAAYEQTLWGVYDVPAYTRNLFNLPVVAYSGELDKQIQAARVMEEAFTAEGRRLPHLIGPGVGHKYEPRTLSELMRQMEGFVRQGRPRLPDKVNVQTRTLRYGRVYWVELLGLDRHWSDARVDASLQGERQLQVVTRNVNLLSLRPRKDMRGTRIVIDGQKLEVPDDGQPVPQALLVKRERWQLTSQLPSEGLAKRPGLQGPIDDAFLEPFLVVTPGRNSAHPQVQRWVDFELDHLRRRWKALFRGRLPEKRDADVQPGDMAGKHLVLFGDPASNQVMREVLAADDSAFQLPVDWDPGHIRLGQHLYSAADHLPLLIYPNPLSPQKYVVINSGPTFREGHDRTNSLQNPKLPDWAIVDLSQPPDELLPGRIAAAGFFDEQWQPAQPTGTAR